MSSTHLSSCRSARQPPTGRICLLRRPTPDLGWVWPLCVPLADAVVFPRSFGEKCYGSKTLGSLFLSCGASSNNFQRSAVCHCLAEHLFSLCASLACCLIFLNLIFNAVSCACLKTAILMTKLGRIQLNWQPGREGDRFPKFRGRERERGYLSSARQEAD